MMGNSARLPAWLAIPVVACLWLGAPALAQTTPNPECSKIIGGCGSTDKFGGTERGSQTDSEKRQAAPPRNATIDRLDEADKAAKSLDRATSPKRYYRAPSR